MLVAASIGLAALVIVTTRSWQARDDASASPRFAAQDAARTTGTAPRLRDSPADAKPAQPARPVYRYSIVPGGVRSAQEVIRAIANDPVVAAHYAGIAANNLRLVRLTRPLAAHVSYRIGDRIYWTQRKLILPVGEPVLTDGKTTLRARCGNIVSTYLRTPTFAGESTAIELELNREPIELLSVSAPDARMPRMISQRVASPEQFARRPEVPEPSLQALLILGIAAALARYLHKRRSRR